MDINEKESYCPYCGEAISLLIDDSLSSQEYVEDCHVCCNPILVRLSIYEESITIDTAKEDDGF